MSNVLLANQHMRIEEVFALLDAEAVAGRKNYCPFGDWHADGGMTPSLRIYPDTNSSYCFACQEAHRPVSLLAKARDITWDEAAQWILEEVGYIEPDVDDRLTELLADDEPLLSREDLAQALDTYCQRICPTWHVTQLRDKPATKFAQCLSILDSVQSPADAARWLDVTKQLMRKVLNPDTPEEPA